MRQPGTLEDDLRLLELIRTHIRGDGSPDEVARILETWTDDQRYTAVLHLVAHVISMASEVAPIYEMTVEQLVDRWEESARQNEVYRQKLMSEDSP